MPTLGNDKPDALHEVFIGAGRQTPAVRDREAGCEQTSQPGGFAADQRRIGALREGK
jgi:hypothetical protein